MFKYTVHKMVYCPDTLFALLDNQESADRVRQIRTKGEEFNGDRTYYWIGGPELKGGFRLEDIRNRTFLVRGPAVPKEVGKAKWIGKDDPILNPVAGVWYGGTRVALVCEHWEKE